MQSNSDPNKQKHKPTSKEERLKAALKANMGRRKAQARARAVSCDDTNTGEQDKGDS